MCDCIEKLNTQIKREVDPEARLDVVLSFNFAEDKEYQYPRMNLLKPSRNLDGEIRVPRHTSKPIMEKQYIIPQFCPFCGKAYKEE